MKEQISLLIIDDEEGVLRNLAAYFDDEGFKVFTAVSGEDALAVLAESKIDVAIVDMRLPGINGNEVIEQSYARNHKVKFLIHTGSNSYSLPKSLRDMGMTECNIFLKPVVDMAKLKSAIVRLLGIEA